MTIRTDASPPQANIALWLKKVVTSLALGIALFLGSIAIFSIGLSLSFSGKIYPGVWVNGVDLSGLTILEAEAELSARNSFLNQGNIVTRYQDREWAFSPEELGFQLDGPGSAELAYSIGRQALPWERLREQFQSIRDGFDLAPKLILDEGKIHAVLDSIANEINRETIEAKLSVSGLEVDVSDGQVGIALDTETSTHLVSAQLLQMHDGEIALPVFETAPRILDVSEQAAIAREILSKDLRIRPGGDYSDNPKAWKFEASELANLLSIERVDSEDGAQYQIGLDSLKLSAFIAALAPQVLEEYENPRFIFNDARGELELIQSEIIGRRLEVEASVEHINLQLALGNHAIDLQYAFQAPIIRENARASDLGISELVSSQTTYFYGSSTARMQNIQTAAARFHGLLVEPGAIFSMVENIGDISLDSGFAEALIIYGDRTIKGVGGGICQVSTTLFRTVFFGGFPVAERNPHAYRVYYYERNQAGGIDPNAVGLDATVYAPIVDFKFTNDSPYWLLMETYVDIAARTINWKFYSTSDGRSVEWTNSGVTKVVEAPDPIYEESEDLEKGEVKQVDWEADGADVSVTRTVSRNGDVLFEDVFKTHYRPWAAVYQYGPGTPGYPPETKEPVNN